MIHRLQNGGPEAEDSSFIGRETYGVLGIIHPRTSLTCATEVWEVCYV